MLLKNVVAILELNCLAASLIKNTREGFCHGTTVLRVCFVDIVVSSDFSVSLCSFCSYSVISFVHTTDGE